jgi:hypothetical protein
MILNRNKLIFPESNTFLHHKCLIAYILLLILIEGCSSSGLKDKIETGIVEFDISYTNNSGRNFPVQLLPKTIEMKFNNNFASYTIEDRVGLFSICNILDLNDHLSHTLIKVFDKKYVYHGPPKETPIFFKNKNPYIVKYLSDTMRVAGVLCKKANITDTETSKTFEILYTSSFNIQDINNNTPYEKIKGVLLQFDIQMKNLGMKLTAKKVEQQDIKDQDFRIPKGYKLITKKQMEEIINTLLP